jgi:hypothetical protein
MGLTGDVSQSLQVWLAHGSSDGLELVLNANI